MEYSLVTNEDFPRFYKIEIEAMGKSKREHFSSLNELGEIDYALPQDFLDMLTVESGLDYYLILFTTCWAYTKNNFFGGPVSYCVEVQAALEKYYFCK